MNKQKLDRLAANNRKKFEQFLVRMIVGTTMTYAEIARTVGLGSATEVGRIAKKHNVRRPKGLGSPAYKLTKNHPPKY
jgi:O6-methylguanine-DNA--protein-cysteine methyltransferase